MLFGKYVNKYYLKYAILFIIGIAALIAVDFIQTLIPEYLGEVVDILQHGGDTNRIFVLGGYVIAVAAVMFLPRAPRAR